MKPPKWLEVDPAMLKLPGGRRDGADPGKLRRQIASFGTSINGMPTVLVSRDNMGNLVINDGVTRATRVARLLPNQTLIVEVIDELPVDLSALPTVGEQMP
jgi:hypothetical protein